MATGVRADRQEQSLPGQAEGRSLQQDRDLLAMSIDSLLLQATSTYLSERRTSPSTGSVSPVMNPAVVSVSRR